MNRAERTHAQQGMALLLTLVILAVLSIMATTFITNVTLDQKAAANLGTDVTAQYIAKAGLHHALSVLVRDADFVNPDMDIAVEAYDWSSGDDWVTRFSGSDVCVAESITRSTGVVSHKKNARWIYVHESPDDASSPIVGRYAVYIADEHARVNINAVGADYDSVESSQEGESVEEIDLKDLFENLAGVDNSLASDIVTFANKPFASISELYNIAGIDESELDDLGPYLTTESADHLMYWDNYHTPTDYRPTVNVNYDPRIKVFAENLFNHMWWMNPPKEYIAAINLLDYRDSDHIPTHYTETELNTDINGDGNILDTTSVYGVEGLQINEILPDAWVEIAVTDATFISKESGDFVIGATYAQGTSTDFANIASATFQIPWDNGTFTVKIYSYSDASSDDISCRVEGVGHETVPGGGGSHEFDVTVTDGTITIELIDPVQTEIDGSPSATQIPSKFHKVEIQAGEFVEIVNISREQITIPTTWTFVFDNGTPADSSDDRSYHVSSAVTLNGAVRSSADPVTASYSYLILTDSEKALDMIFGSVIDGIWDGTGTVRVPFDASNGATFSILDSGDDAVTLTDDSGEIIDHIAPIDTNDYCVSGYKPGAGMTAKTSREKKSPDYDLNVTWIDVWQDSTTVATDVTYKGTPGSSNSSCSSYVTVRDSLIPNPFFLYDLSKGEDLNNPANAMSSTRTYLMSFRDMFSFDIYEVNGGDIVRKVNWSVSTNGTDTYLALPSATVSGSKITLWDFTGPSVPNGEYRIFLSAMEEDEIHLIAGQYLDSGSSSLVDTTVSVNVNETMATCLNGDYLRSEEIPFIQDAMKVRYDELIPFNVDLEYFTMNINCDASTPTTENTIYKLRFQPAGFMPLTEGKININTADIYTLQTIPGVDATLALNIVTYSESFPFSAISDLLNVTGMTLSQYCRMYNLVTVRSNSYRVTVIGQSIKDVDRDGTMDSSDVIVGQKQCTTSVFRNVKKDSNEQPTGIEILTRSMLWE